VPKLAPLLDGFDAFRARYFDGASSLYSELALSGQKPHTLFVACSDSRVDPAILFNVEPGEFFVVRNVANLVPPYQPDGGLHGTSSAIEYAVRDLLVSQIVVCGHSNCGGIDALVRGLNGEVIAREFIGPWVSIAEEAVRPHCQSSSKEAEQAGVLSSLSNLKTFPWIQARLNDGSLELHGLWFDRAAGELVVLDQPPAIIS
jgi:carbonic anhydrase